MTGLYASQKEIDKLVKQGERDKAGGRLRRGRHGIRCLDRGRLVSCWGAPQHDVSRPP